MELFKNVNKSQISRRTFIINLIDEINTLKSQDDSSQNKENTPLGKGKEAASIDTPVNKRVRRSVVETPSKECQFKFCNKNKSKDACTVCLKACCGKCAADITTVKSIICKT